MFSYSQIARWLTYPLDPISVEDWVGNREVFGPGKNLTEEEKELELAFQIESAKGKQLGEVPDDVAIEVLLNGYEVPDLFERADFLIIAPVGVAKNEKSIVGSVWIYGDQVTETKLPAGDVLVIEMGNGKPTKIKVKLGSGFTINKKAQAEWTGSEKKKLIFDLRGRPLPEISVGKWQQEKNRKLKSHL